MTVPSHFDHGPLNQTSELGFTGEHLAAEFLIEKGFRLVAANFRVPVGRNSVGAQVTGEIDLIALDHETLCFIEVKTRRSEAFTPVITAVDLRKKRQITRTAKVYRKIFGVRGVDHRFDVVTVLISDENKPRIEHHIGFWTEAQFRKRNWNDQVNED